MAKSKTRNQNKSNRRMLVDDRRKKRLGATRTRDRALLTACAVIAVGIIAAAAYGPLKNAYDQRQFNDSALENIGASPTAAGCQKPFTLSSATTKNLPTDIYYTTAPPAFGPAPTELSRDNPAPFGTTFYTASNVPDLASLVRNLDDGYTILWYDDTVTGTELEQIRAIANKFTATNDFRDKFIAVPWTAKDASTTRDKGVAHTSFPTGTHIAFTHWTGKGGQSGVSQGIDEKGDFEFCTKVSGLALKDFMRSHPYTESPDPTST